MKKTIAILVIASLLIFSAFVFAQPIAEIRNPKIISKEQKVRLIISATQTIPKECKVIHELEEETSVECPQEIAKTIPNSIQDQKYQILDDLLPRNTIPKDINPQDLIDNAYLQVPKLWSAGITGKGTVVAILDTGVDYNHPSLSNHILANKSFVNYTTDPMDDDGHGTHVSGIITSDGNPEVKLCYNETEISIVIVNCSEPHQYEYITIPENLSKGIAPDAKIIMGKVCDQGGICWSSDVIAGLYWVVKGVNVSSPASCYEKCLGSSSCCNRIPECSYNTTSRKCAGNYTKTETVKPDVISMSLGDPYRRWIFSNCDQDSLAKKMNDIVRKYKIPLVLAAGNGGYGVSTPACAKEVIAAGAAGGFSWCSDSLIECWYKNIASFSGRGFAMKDHGIMAPGVSVFSTLPNNNFGYMTGTSMATPDVAGLIALMKQQHPNWSVAQIKSKLFQSAIPMEYGFYFEEGYEDYEQGYGLISTTAV